MVDLVKQLREPVSGESAQVMVRWAADEIERLRHEATDWKERALNAERRLQVYSSRSGEAKR
jgi:hypothetical protein